MARLEDPPWIASAPWWISLPASAGGTLILATLPPESYSFVRIIGILLLVLGIVAGASRGLYKLAKRVGIAQATVIGCALGASALIIIGLLASLAYWRHWLIGGKLRCLPIRGVAQAIGAVPVEQGPLFWSRSLILEPQIGSGVVYSLRFQAANGSNEELRN